MWQDIIKKFNQSDLDYVVVGAVALIIHGLPRSTVDLDLYLPAKKGIIEALFKITDCLGLKSEQKAIVKLSKSPELFSGQWICFSYEGQDILDVFFANQPEFLEIYKRSQLKKSKNFKIRVAALDDIVLMKRQSGRTIDLADINLIKEAKQYRTKKK